MKGQLTLLDWMPEAVPEPEVGDLITQHGAVIPHIMRPGYIGRKIAYDYSTENHECFKVGVLEKYFECFGVMRSVIFTGKRQRTLLDHRPGKEIFEVKPRRFI